MENGSPQMELHAQAESAWVDRQSFLERSRPPEDQPGRSRLGSGLLPYTLAQHGRPREFPFPLQSYDRPPQLTSDPLGRHAVHVPRARAPHVEEDEQERVDCSLESSTPVHPTVNIDTELWPDSLPPGMHPPARPADPRLQPGGAR